MNPSNSPIVDALVRMLDSARAQDPDGRRLAIEIAQNMERDRNEHYNVLKCNAENNAKTIAALTAENVAFREMCEERNILKNERMVTVLTEENRMLRETYTARLEQVKRQNERLREDLQVYRSACVSNHPLTGEASSAAKRPRADSPDGSGAKP
jgi:hypothetical protein